MTGLVRIVAEAHVVEVHLALDVLATHAPAPASGSSSGSSRNSKMRSAAAAICCSTLRHLRELGDGLREVLHVLDERLDVADGDDALHGQEAARDAPRPRSPGCPRSS